jgi:pimeloyl-ACP methyl ester carboxylesterase
MKRKVVFLLLACVLAVWPTGCAFAPKATAPLVREGMITFTRYDGQKYFGTVHGHGKTAIILANMAYGGEEQWQPFVEAFDKDKFTVITFNYLEAGQGDYAAAENEVVNILDTLKGFGYKRVICMGASMGVSACTFISHAPEMAGIVLISGPNYGGTLDTSYPKLFICGKLDQWSAPIESEYKRADEPKTLILYPDIAHHGTDLFYSTAKDQFLKSLLDFVNNLQAPAG